MRLDPQPSTVHVALQVERLQQRNAELEDEHSLARQRFQTRLQQLHESWQDCFDRHQRSWEKQKAQAEVQSPLSTHVHFLSIATITAYGPS